MPEPVITVEKLYPDTRLPEYSTVGSAGMDAYAQLGAAGVLVYDRGNNTLSRQTTEGGEVYLNPGDRALIHLGFKAALPPGWECQVRSRSGLALKQGLVVVNSPGTIDEDYPGEWAVLLTNVSNKVAWVRHHDRIAQLVVQPRHALWWTAGTVRQSTERVGGYGSTGV